MPAHDLRRDQTTHDRPTTAAGAPPGTGGGPGRVRGLLRELRSWPTLLLVAVCLGAGIPATVALTPPQEVVAVGQPLAVGARAPSLSISGPAQLVQIGNTALDLPRLQVTGPLRPRLELGPIRRNAAAAQVFDPLTRAQVQAQAVSSLVDGFVRWYVLGGLGLVVFTLAAAAGAGVLRVLLILRRRSRAGDGHPRLADVWHDASGAVGRMTVIALAAVVLGWLASGALAYTGTVQGLAQVRSLPDLVGTSPVTPAPAGPEVRGFEGAVIGDSRAVRVGGPPLPDGTPEDRACERSTDSLAAETGRILDVEVLNLACPGASIATGLRGPQERAGLLLDPQVGRLKQVRDLDFVVVAIGPNDVVWSDFLAYCYAVEDCTDRLTQGEFDYRLAAFDQSYGELLADLADLPDDPQVVVVTSYDVLEPDADCPDARGPAGVAGLSPREIELLAARNADLNAILEAGARAYGFAVASPNLGPLCDPTRSDLQGLTTGWPFHPTGEGSLRMAASVVRWIGDDAAPPP